MSPFAYELLAGALEHEDTLESFTLNESVLPIQKLRSRNEEWNTVLNTVGFFLSFAFKVNCIQDDSRKLCFNSSWHPGSAIRSAL